MNPAGRRFLRYGAPFLALLVAGSFGLKQFAQLRYQFRKVKPITPEEAAEMGIQMKTWEERPSLEKDLEDLKKADLDTWENIRGPRPWEDSKTVQDELRKAAASR